MEIDLWKKDFKNYMDFVYNNKRYPNKSKDLNELYLFNWAKNQRCSYTRKKLSNDKIELLKNFKFWYFKSTEKNKQLININNFFSEKIQENNNMSIKNNINNDYNNTNNIIINISNLNIFYEKEYDNKDTIFDKLYKKIKGYISHYINNNNNLFIDNV
jgi:hypothetical protein